MKSGKPWEIDIADLLGLFIMAILKRKQTDLRLCGSVALSSALLYRFKVETIFYFERLRAERIEHPRDEPPSIIVLPFRYELYSTSIDDLVASLETILNEALSQSRQKEKAKKIEPELEVEIDQYIFKIEEMVRDFRAKLTRSLRDTGDTLFSKLIDGASALEKAKTFILLLFVATEGIVKLAQEGNDIRITMVI
ncbi:MAG: hypothetical protein HYY67_06490 [Thaumarchaeota archaeon]|nr:hypothetical protein [Nitrososphaerota archaeon]